MPRMIFVNLPVSDLAASMAFYEALGFTNNPQFTDATAACMVWSEAIYVMLLTHDKWRSFTDRPIAPAGSSEVSLALALDSREAVDAMIEAAAANGGIGDANPVQELGFMYGRDLTDPDGHVWGPFWMDMTAMPAG
jgi:predicted lactoylglutathione lyase